MSFIPASSRRINSNLSKTGSLCWIAIFGCTTAISLHPLTDLAIAQESSNEATPAQSASSNTVLMVNPTEGNDASADGSESAPFKTITQALQVAQPSTVIQLTPGTYSAETGETFPIRLKAGITIQGNVQTRGQEIEIRGSGSFLSPTFARQNVTVLGANQATIAGVTIKNPHPQGYGLWIESSSPSVTDCTFTASGHDGISVTGNSAPTIQNNYFFQNGANGITIYGTSSPEVRENIFERTGFAINTNQNSKPLIIGNRITDNRSGIVVQANSKPILRNNSIGGNAEYGLVAIAQSRPDLGTSTQAGGNSFFNNGQFDVNVKALKQTIPAFGNEFSKTVGQLDLAGSEPTISEPGTNLSTSTIANRSLVASINRPSDSVQPADFPMPPVRSSAQAVDQAVTFGTPLETTKTVTSGNISVSKVATPPIALVPNNPPASNSGPTSTSNISAASFPVPGSGSASSNSEPRVVPSPIAQTPEAAANATPSFPSPVTPAQPGVSPSRPRSLQVASLNQSPAPLNRPTSPTSQPFPTPVSERVPLRPSAPPSIPSVSASSITPAPQAPIPILVPLPERGSSVAMREVSRPNPAARLVVSRTQLPAPRKVNFDTPTTSRSIPIPVPQPESRSVPSPVPAEIATPPSTAIAMKSTQVGVPDLLPVPGPNVPIGNVGSSPAANIYRSSQQRSLSASSASGLRYRVVMEALDYNQQSQARTLVPDAFRTYLKGRTVMQLGAFGDRSKADEFLQTLSGQGVQATIETLD